LSVFLAYNQSPAGQWLCPLFADNLPHYQTPDEKHMTNEEILAQFGPREAMEYDVVVVGAGPRPGLATAIRLKQLAAERGQRRVGRACSRKAPSPARTSCPAR
jgi:hypothetical protein